MWCVIFRGHILEAGTRIRQNFPSSQQVASCLTESGSHRFELCLKYLMKTPLSTKTPIFHFSALTFHFFFSFIYIEVAEFWLIPLTCSITAVMPREARRAQASTKFTGLKKGNIYATSLAYFQGTATKLPGDPHSLLVAVTPGGSGSRGFTARIITPPCVSRSKTCITSVHGCADLEEKTAKSSSRKEGEKGVSRLGSAEKEVRRHMPVVKACFRRCHSNWEAVRDGI